jgi:GNAT superfamily N-acetyltransferase
LDIREISVSEALPVRHRVLWPEKPPEFCRVPGDEAARHFGVYIRTRLVSVASIYLDEEGARLRKFATLEAFQGQGIGTRLLRHVLASLHREGVGYLWCDARATALGFYARFGMKPEGEQFYKSGVPYFRMGMMLEPAAPLLDTGPL